MAHFHNYPASFNIGHVLKVFIKYRNTKFNVIRPWLARGSCSFNPLYSPWKFILCASRPFKKRYTFDHFGKYNISVQDMVTTWAPTSKQIFHLSLDHAAATENCFSHSSPSSSSRVRVAHYTEHRIIFFRVVCWFRVLGIYPCSNTLSKRVAPNKLDLKYTSHHIRWLLCCHGTRTQIVRKRHFLDPLTSWLDQPFHRKNGLGAILFGHQRRRCILFLLVLCLLR